MKKLFEQKENGMFAVAIKESKDEKKIVEDAAANLRKLFPLLQQIKKDLQSTSVETASKKEMEMYKSIIGPVQQEFRALLKLNRETIKNMVKAKDPELGMDNLMKKSDELNEKITPAAIKLYNAIKQSGEQGSKEILTFINKTIEADVTFYQEMLKLYDEFNVR